MSKQKFNYKEAISEIEEIVGKIESGEPDVDELSGMVKNALTLLKKCKEKLKKTEGDIQNTLEEME